VENMETFSETPEGSNVWAILINQLKGRYRLEIV